MELKKEGKYWIAIQRKKPFREWLEGNVGIDKFKKMSLQSKKEIFLRWKQGMGSESNSSLELSEMGIFKIIKDLTPEHLEKGDRGVATYLREKIEWHKYCLEVWRSIEDGTFFLDAFAQEVKDEFSGKVGYKD